MSEGAIRNKVNGSRVQPEGEMADVTAKRYLPRCRALLGVAAFVVLAAAAAAPTKGHSFRLGTPPTKGHTFRLGTCALDAQGGQVRYLNGRITNPACKPE